ncbi:ATP-binding protein [candidate division CSSED10-310 bacterium]|uniref:histidine kinase n=1 Tax=candidate division CSSED10-310 bacterium TaxID=2855610 RepID=A0ABV6YV65_UNCC1
MTTIYFGIRFKVIFGVVIIMIMIMTGMTFVLIEKGQEDILQQVEKRGKALISYLENNIQAQYQDKERFLEMSKSDVFQKITSLYTSDPELRELLIISQSKRIIAHSNEEMWGHYYPEPDVDAVFNIGKETALIVGHQKENMVIIKPILYDGEVLGVIRAVFTLSEVLENLSLSRISTFKVIFVESVVIIIFISLLLSMMVARPIERLAKITNKIASGDLNSRVERVSNDEFGYLASAFNRMTEQLQKTHRSLEQHIHSQEDAYRALKETQDHLIASEKLASVGRLAAGVAHEIGNPLSSILGYTDILAMTDLRDADKMDYLKRIQQAIDRIQKIIRELLDFSRPASLEVHPIDLREVLNKTTLLASHHPALQNINIEMDLPPDLPYVIADEHPLSQVFLNILINGAQAMKNTPGEERNQINISVAVFPQQPESSGLDENKLIVGESFSYQAADNCSLIVSFRDYGPGISKENLGRVFDPFFTTKSSGEGSGLGLTICHTIVDRLHGSIKIESIVGTGTTVSVSLPAAEVIAHYNLPDLKEKHNGS